MADEIIVIVIVSKLAQFRISIDLVCSSRYFLMLTGERLRVSKRLHCSIMVSVSDRNALV